MEYVVSILNGKYFIRNQKFYFFSFERKCHDENVFLNDVVALRKVKSHLQYYKLEFSQSVTTESRAVGAFKLESCARIARDENVPAFLTANVSNTALMISH